MTFKSIKIPESPAYVLRRARVPACLVDNHPVDAQSEADGSLLLADIEDAIKPDDSHYARTRLLALENTIGGKVLSQDYMEAATALARRHGLATHLDGARVFNAATVLNTPVATLAKPFDTVSVCLSKGLGAPVGSVLVGSEQLIAKARRTRKMVGGGLRQVGILAAAGLYALEHNVVRLADDHANAATLAKGLSAYEQLKVTMPDTNIVFVEVDSTIAADFKAHLAARGIGITSAYSATKQRWVTHLDVDSAAVETALAAVRAFFSAR